ncbi:MAG: FHA domain-containing protein, partial [Tepidiformaceae bacterium]
MKFGTLQVFPRQGLLQEHGLELASSVVGRGEGANILIDDFSISRRHARLTIDSGRLLIEDLGSVGGTFVDGERLEPGVRHLVDDKAVLKFGEIEAHFLPVAEAETPGTAAGNAATTQDVTTVGGLSAALVSPALPIEPGKVAAATLVITNRGRLVDNVRVEIPELPADWVTIETPAFAILPGGRSEVKVNLHPPRRHESLAGEYTFGVFVRSQEYDEGTEVQGRFEILPYESATLELEAIRSKKRFRLFAENHGNDVARYALAGKDEEQAFRYEFETPVVELKPGERRMVPLVIRHKRELFGPAKQPQFQVIGTSPEGVEIATRGQLAIKPPLQKFRMPVMFGLVAMVLAVVAIGVLIITDGSGTKTASAEDPFAGVHLCDDSKSKDDQAKKNEEAANETPPENASIAGTYDGGKAIFGQTDSNGAPFFAQNDPRWGGQEYARSLELPNGKDWCGSTIEQCGCAMTSVSVMLALYDLVKMPDGEPLNPKTLNDWFNGDATKTDRGFVSRGYIYGDVIWTAANELSGEIAKTNPNATTVRFAGTGDGSEDDIRGQLTAGHPVVVEVPGHWIAAVGIDADTNQILINDPFYRDRKTLDAYKGKVRSSVHYEPSKDLSSVVITAPADVKFRVTDKSGRVVNTGDGTIEQPADVINQIPGASVSSRAAWRDPTCIEKAPPTGAGTNQVVLPGSADDYVIEILGTGGEPGSVAIHTYGKDGEASISTIEGGEGTKADVAYDPNADKPVIKVSTNGTPQATMTPTTNAGGGAGGDDETPTPQPTVPTPSATATPFVEQRTAMTLPAEPGQTRVEVATNSGFELGDPIRFAPGLPNEEDNVIVGFGSFILATPLKFAHSPGEPIQRLPRPPGQGPGLPPGITPPPSTGPIEPPKEVAMACSTIYQGSPKLATLICDLQVDGDYTSTRWTINGKVVSEFTGSPSLIMTFPGDTPANVSATVCNVTLCRSTTKSSPVEFPANLGGGTQFAPTGGGSGAAPSPTPPAGTVTVTCGTSFDQNVKPAVANITCQANFAGDFTSVSWSAPGGSPSSASGPKKTFETKLVNELGSPTTVKITATVCNFGTCRTSKPQTVGVGQTRTTIDTDPQGGVPLKHSVTLLAVVTGLNGIVPQGGNVQFVAISGDDEFAISPSAGLFTVGSLSIAQVSVQTAAVSGLDTVGPHQIRAVYSGGVNAFGSNSPVRDLDILEPIRDDCNSVDEDAGTPETDDSCDIAVPKTIGAGTRVNSLSITGGVPDGATNAVIATPGEDLTVSGTVGRTEYCPGCIRQLYLGIAGYDPQPQSLSSRPALRDGPKCLTTGAMPLAPAGVNYSTTFKAPMEPGIYYLRASTTLDYFCVGPPMGPPDSSVGRIVVSKDVITTIDMHATDADTNPWNDDLAISPLAVTANAGDRILLRAKVPPGATGRVRFYWLGATILGPVCPPSETVPEGDNEGFKCTPGEARILSPVIDDSATSINVAARYIDPSPLRLNDPQNGTGKAYPLYEAPCLPTTDPCSNPVMPLKVKVSAAVVITASPGLPGTPVQMGQPFTLTATVTSANTSLGLFGTGGTVQFWSGTTKLGDIQPVGADGIATLQWWTGREPTSCPVAQPGACGGSPFLSQDDVYSYPNLYQAVHAEFLGNSDLKAQLSSNLDIDIAPAPSETAVVLSVPGTSSPIGDS